MKILFTSHWYPHDENPMQGIFIKNHLKAIRAQDIDVECIVFRICKSNKLLSIKKQEIQDGTRIEISSFFWKFIYTLYGLQWYLIRRSIRKFCSFDSIDLIHSNVGHPNGVMARRLAKQMSVPYVISEHHSQAKRMSEHWLFGREYRKVYRDANRIFPVSKKLEEIIHEISSKAKTKIVSNVIDSTIFKYTNSHTKEGQIRFVSVANWDFSIKNTKKPELLVEAVCHYCKENNISARITHIGKCSIQSELSEMCRKSEVVFESLGILQPIEINGILNKSDYMLHATEAETFCVVAVEAQKSGIPCLISKVAPIPDVVHDYGVVFKDNLVFEWSKGISELILANFDRAKIAEFAKPMYTKEDIGKRIIEAYQEVLEDNQSYKR